MPTRTIGSSPIMPCKSLTIALRPSIHPPNKDLVDVNKSKPNLKPKSHPALLLLKLIHYLPNFLKNVFWPLILAVDVLRNEDSSVWCFTSGFTSNRMVDHHFFLDLCSESRTKREAALQSVIDVEYELSLMLSDDFQNSIQKQERNKTIADARAIKVDESFSRQVALSDFNTDLKVFLKARQNRTPSLLKIYLLKRILAKLCGSINLKDQRTFIKRAMASLDKSKVERKYSSLLYRQFIVNPKLRNGEGVVAIRAVVDEIIQNSREIILSLDEIANNSIDDEVYRLTPKFGLWPLFKDRWFFPERF